MTWIRTALIVAVVVGAGYWIWSRPSDEERQREKMCRDWGYADDVSLAKCRESQTDADAVIAPRFRKAALETVTNFNKELAALSLKKTKVDTLGYKPLDIRRAAQIMSFLPKFGAGSGKNSGERFMVAGKIVTETPPSDDNDGDHTWQPLTYELWGPSPKSANESAPFLKLDIESLDRDERSFIQNRCELISVVECQAVVYGHVGKIFEGTKDFYYSGLIADQVDIRSIDTKTYRIP